MTRFNSTELIDRVKENTEVELSTRDAKDIVKTVFKVIMDCLSEGDEVVALDFGVFTTFERKSREGRNPLTGEPITIPAKRVVRFKPGKALKNAVL